MLCLAVGETCYEDEERRSESHTNTCILFMTFYPGYLRQCLWYLLLIVSQDSLVINEGSVNEDPIVFNVPNFSTPVSSLNCENSVKDLKIPRCV